MVGRLFFSALLITVTLPLDALLQIRLRTAVLVGQREVRLADIVTGYSGGYSSVVVAQLSQGETSLLLEYEELCNTLKRIFRRPLILIGGSVRVTLMQEEVSRSALLSLLRRQYPGCADRVRITLKGESAVVRVVGRLLSLKLEGEPRSETDGTFLATFRAAGSGSSVVFSRAFTLSRLFYGWRLARALPAGHKLKRSDFVRVTVGGETPRLPLPRCLGRILARNVQKGGLLKLDDMVKKVTVRAGELIRILYRAPGITFEFTGRAVESGGDGDTVRVRNALTGRMLDVRIGAGGRATLSGKRAG